MKFYTKSLVKSLLIIGICSAISSCATVGEPFTYHGNDSIVVGKTTQSDITRQYGKPYRVGVENGKTKWTYNYYKYHLFGEPETKDLSVTFNSDGVVSDYTYSTSNPGEMDDAK
jgi:hypothetical protein